MDAAEVQIEVTEVTAAGGDFDEESEGLREIDPMKIRRTHA